MLQRAVTAGISFGIFVLCAASAQAQLAADWIVPASAHSAGVGDTFWRTDLSIHNPHEFDLPVVVQALPTDTVNLEVPTLLLNLQPWETANIWDVVGEGGFGIEGSAALLVYADPSLVCDPIEDCHLLVTSRTYTPAPGTVAGEYGLTVSGAPAEFAVHWSTLGYAAGILNDGELFRCNVGVASWTEQWTTVRLDVQDADGVVIASEQYNVPPFGHVQERLDIAVFGGSLVFYLDDGPDGALVFPYATVINQETGDASYVSAMVSPVGHSVAKAQAERPLRPSVPGVGGHGTIIASEASRTP
jgi:hypothetical protein